MQTVDCQMQQLLCVALKSQRPLQLLSVALQLLLSPQLSIVLAVTPSASPTATLTMADDGALQCNDRPVLLQGLLNFIRQLQLHGRHLCVCEQGGVCQPHSALHPLGLCIASSITASHLY